MLSEQLEVCIKYFSERNWFEPDCQLTFLFLTAVIAQWKSAENRTFVNTMPNDCLVRDAIYCRQYIVYECYSRLVAGTMLIYILLVEIVVMLRSAKAPPHQPVAVYNISTHVVHIYVVHEAALF